MIAFVSIVSSMLVAYSIVKVKKLRQHPNLLIAYLSIANIISCWALLIFIIGTPDFVCYFGLAQSFHYSVNFAFKAFPSW